jgi:hypothetical protein
MPGVLAVCDVTVGPRAPDDCHYLSASDPFFRHLPGSDPVVGFSQEATSGVAQLFHTTAVVCLVLAVVAVIAALLIGRTHPLSMGVLHGGTDRMGAVVPVRTIAAVALAVAAVVLFLMALLLW